MDDLTREFLIESQEGLDRMERCLTDLEERPEDASILADIFRSVHTIKGATGFLGFSRLESLAHAGENLLGLLRDGKLAANAEIISGLLVLLDALRAILQSIEDEGNEGEGSDEDLIGRLVALQQPAVGTKAAAADRAPSQNHPLPESPAPATIPALAAGSPAAETETKNSARKGAPAAAESTLRVDVNLLNRMMNLVGELVLTRNQILQATASDVALTALSRRLDMVTADLRESVMRARMQPVSYVFSKFPRILRDLSRSLGKRVRLQMEGQETELDKSLLEAIKDPLTHAVRNSIDHGIEMPEVREAAGKDPEGTLRLRAFQEGSHVLIELIDDGAGIRSERIRAKALDRGLVTAERAAQMSERELLQLIFLPGFSTAEKITNVSGRGVGMDVVRTNVERIGGKVEIESKPGRGTTLRLRIPLTLAIIPALIVRSAEQNFALPQGALFELVHLSAEEAKTAIEWIEDTPLYRLRGKLLPLIFLDKMLGMEQADRERPGRYIAILDAEGRRFGLVVDGLEDPEEIVVKPLSAVLKEIGLYSGATVLGNGKLALILDPGTLATRGGVSFREADEDDAAEDAESAGAVDRSEYLLVEAAGERAALPLDDVLRIERLPLSRMERIGATPVLQFDGQLLALEDAAGIFHTAGGDANAQMTVVVCKDRHRHVGVTVSHVLDVAAGQPLAEAGANAIALGVTLLKERVTGVVNLSRVPQLPGGAQEAEFEESDGSSHESEWEAVV